MSVNFAGRNTKEIIPESVYSGSEAPDDSSKPVTPGVIPKKAPQRIKKSLADMRLQLIAEITAKLPELRNMTFESPFADMVTDMDDEALPDAQSHECPIHEDTLSDEVLDVFRRIFWYLQKMQESFDELKDLYDQSLKGEAARLMTMAHVLQHMMKGAMP